MFKRYLALLTVSAFYPFFTVSSDQTFTQTDTTKPQKQGMWNQAVNPSARPEVNDGIDLFVIADYLLWQPTEQNLSYATNDFQNRRSAEIFNVRFDLRSGFRLGCGYNIDHDQWDTNVRWTWLNDQGNNQVGPEEGALIFSTVSGANLNVTSSRARSNLKLLLNLLDWELGREFYSSQWISLRPFIGLRAGWVNQTWTSDFFEDLTVSAAAARSFTTKLKQDFWGIGLRAGLGSEWTFFKSLSIYADGALSLLYGFYKDLRRETFIDLGGTEQKPTNVKDSQRSEQAVTELQMGIRWDQMFSDDKYHLRVQVGWEHLVFFEHNHMFNFQRFVAALSEYNGNLAFQGLSVSTRFDF